jgi:hypothetical protein
MTEETPPDLPEEDMTDLTSRLVVQVGQLNKTLTISQRQQQRTQMLTWVSIAVALVAVVGMVVSLSLYFAVRHEADANHATQVQTCQTGNDSRKAAQATWTFFINLLAPNPTATQNEVIKTFKDYLGAVYAPRDCVHLGTAPTIPPPPTLPTPSTSPPSTH